MNSPNGVLTDFFNSVIHEHGWRPALRWRQGYRHYGITFQELGRAVHSAAHLLHESGLRPDDRVLLLGPGGPEWVVAFFGIVLNGGVVVPLDEGSRPDFVAEVARQTGLRLQVVATGLPKAPNVPALTFEQFSPLAAGPTLRFVASERRPEDLLEIIYTSGTTSKPRGVMLTHANVCANLSAVRQAMDGPPGVRFMSLLPLSHMLGQMLGLLVPLRFGGTTFFPGTRRPSVLRECLRRERIRVVIAVPAFLDRVRRRIQMQADQQGRSPALARSLWLARYLPHWGRRLLWWRLRRQAFPDLEGVIVGGAALRPDTEEFFHDLGIHVLQGYGMTEASPVVTCNTLTSRRSNTVGRPLPGVEVSSSPEGELLVRGPNVTSGYLNDPEATKQLLEDGWLHTGDLGTVDADGFWRIVGRKKDVLIGPSGMNVYPEDLENVLNHLPGVRESCAVGLEQAGGLGLVGCVLCEDQGFDARASLPQVNAQLAPHQQLQAIRAWPDADFPRTRTLKVRRDAVVTRLQGAKDRSAASQETQADELLGLIRACAELPADHPISEDDRLSASLGLDSLSRVDLLARIEERFGADLSESAIDDQTTVADLRQRIGDPSSGIVRVRFPHWPRRPFWQALRELVGFGWRPLFRGYFSLQSQGQEHLEKLSGPVIFIANHTSHLDSLALQAALPGKWRRRLAVAAAADYWFGENRSWRSALAAAGLVHLIPFSRKGPVAPSLSNLGELIDGDWSVLLFPEGTRSLTGRMAPFKPGIGLIAQAMQVPIVPVALSGCFEALPRDGKVPRAGRIQVRFGAPMMPPFRQSAEAIASLLQERVNEESADLNGGFASETGRGVGPMLRNPSLR